MEFQATHFPNSPLRHTLGTFLQLLSSHHRSASTQPSHTYTRHAFACQRAPDFRDVCFALLLVVHTRHNHHLLSRVCAFCRYMLLLNARGGVVFFTGEARAALPDQFAAFYELVNMQATAVQLCGSSRNQELSARASTHAGCCLETTASCAPAVQRECVSRQPIF